MNPSSIFRLAVIVAGSTFACGGTITGTGGDAAADQSSPQDGSTSKDATTTLDAVAPGACPASVPSGSCSTEGLDCEYGSDARLMCNALATCQAGTWQLRSAADCGIEYVDGGGGCPVDESSVPVGQTCASQNTTCAYPDGVCECGFSGHPPTLGWVCDKPADTNTCPYPRPKLGTPCTSVAQIICDYGSCSALGGSQQVCMNGTWRDQSVACPP